jgi:hypothetical protein
MMNIYAENDVLDSQLNLLGNSIVLKGIQLNVIYKTLCFSKIKTLQELKLFVSK